MSRRNLPIFTPEELGLFTDEEREEILGLQERVGKLKEGSKGFEELRQHLAEFKNIAEAEKRAKDLKQDEGGKKLRQELRFKGALSDLFENNRDMNDSYPDDVPLPTSLAEGDYGILLNLLKRDGRLESLSDRDGATGRLRGYIKGYVAKKELKPLVNSETLDEEAPAAEASAALPARDPNRRGVKFDQAVERRREVRFYNNEGDKSDRLPEIESVPEDDEDEFEPSDENKFVGVRIKDGFVGIADEEESPELKQRIAAATLERAARKQVRTGSILKKEPTTRKAMSKPVYHYIDLPLQEGSEQLGMRVIRTTDGDEIPIIEAMGDDGEYVEAVRGEDAPIYSMAKENVRRVVELQTDGEGYLTTRLDPTFNNARRLDEVARGGAAAVALEWANIHAQIMTLQGEYIANEAGKKGLERELTDLKKSQPYVDDNGDLIDPRGIYSHTVGDRDPQDPTVMAEVLLGYSERLKIPTAARVALTRENEGILGNLRTLSAQSLAYKERLRELDPQAFGENGGELEVVDGHVYIDFTNGNIPKDLDDDTYADLRPDGRPRFSSAGDVDFNLNNLPGSDAGIVYKMQLNFMAQDPNNKAARNTFGVRITKTENGLEETYGIDDYSADVLGPIFIENGFGKPTTAEEAAFFVDFEIDNESNGEIPRLFVDEGAYELSGDRYNPEIVEAKLRDIDGSNPAIAKATLAAYIIELSHVLTAHQPGMIEEENPYEEGAEAAPVFQDLNRLMGLLNNRARQLFGEDFVEVTAGFAPPAPPRRTVPARLGDDDVSTVGGAINSRPKISAKKEFPLEKAGEAFVEKSVADKIRDHATKMANLAVNANNDAEAANLVKTYISQHYQELVDYKVLGQYTTAVPNYDANNKDHRAQVAQNAGGQIAAFVAQCKTYDGANPEFDDFRAAIGLNEDADHPENNSITWVANDRVTDAPELQQQFFWQRTFLAANRAGIAKDAGLSPTIARDKDGKVDLAGEEKRQKKAKDALLEKYKKDPNDGGLAKTSKDGRLTADGIAGIMTLFEMQEHSNPTMNQNIFGSIEYADFTELAFKVAALKPVDFSAATDVDQQAVAAENAIFSSTVDTLFGGYAEFGGGSTRDPRSRSLLPILWMIREAAILESEEEDGKGNKKTFGQVFNEFSLEERRLRDDASITEADRAVGIKKIQNDKKAHVARIVQYLTSLPLGEFEDLYKKAQDQANEKQLAGADDELAFAFHAHDLDGDFDAAKERIKERRQKTPPRVSDVADARLRLVESFEKDAAGKVQMPDGWESKEVVFEKGENGEVDKKRTRIAANNSGPLNYKFAAGEEFKLDEFQVDAEDISNENLPSYSSQTDIGDESLFSARNSKTDFKSGFLVRDFTEPSCLQDLARAVEGMPSGRTKDRIDAGETVYNLAYLSGDDRVRRGNRYVLLAQNKRGTIQTFTTEGIVEKEIFNKNAQFYKENFAYEARMAAMQQAADISLLYLNNFIATEYAKYKKDEKTMEEVLSLPHVVALSESHRDLTAVLKKFGPDEKDSPAKRREKIDQFNDFQNGGNVHRPFFVSEAENLDGVLQSLKTRMEEMQGGATAPKSSSLAQIEKLEVEIKNPTKLTKDQNAAIDKKARKHGSAEMNGYLREKDARAALEAKLKHQLDGKDVKVFEDDYYRANSIRPDFTKGDNGALKKLLLSDIPTSSVPGIVMYNPKPGDPNYVRYEDSSRNTPGKANSVVINFNLPTDENLLSNFDHIAWAYLPGSPQCYVQVTVDFETGNTTIHPEIYHKVANGYDPIKADKKHLLKAGFNDSDANKVLKTHRNFGVLAVCNQGGVRKGVSVKFNENINNKTQEQLKAKTTSATLNPDSPSRNLDCKFAVGKDGKVKAGGTKMLEGLVTDEMILSSGYRGEYKSDYIQSNVGMRNIEIIDPATGKLVKINGATVSNMRTVYAAELPDNVLGVNLHSGKATRFDPPKLVITYKEGAEERTLICDYNEQNMEAVLGRKPDAKTFQDNLAKAKEGALDQDREIAAAQAVTLLDGKSLPAEFGKMNAQFNPNGVRIVLPILALNGEKHSSVSFSAPLIEYYEGGYPEPKYMAFNQKNFAKLYSDDLSTTDFNKLAARIEIQRDATRVPVLFQQDGQPAKELEFKANSGGEVRIDLKKGEKPKSSCAVISAELVLGREQEVVQGQGAKAAPTR